MVRTQLYIFSHRIVHWVYNYMFRLCILAIVRLYCKLLWDTICHHLYLAYEH